MEAYSYVLFYKLLYSRITLLYILLLEDIVPCDKANIISSFI